MDSLYIIGEAFGFAALIEGIFIFISLDKRRILKMKFVSDFLWVINMLCLGAYTGAMLNAVGMIREAIFLQRDRKKFASHIIWLPIFMLLTLLSPTIELLSTGSLDPMAIFPTVGSMTMVVGLYQKNTNHIRFYSFAAMSLWLVYAISIGNISGMISNSIVLVSIIIGIVRYFADKRLNEKGKKQ